MSKENDIRQFNFYLLQNYDASCNDFYNYLNINNNTNYKICEIQDSKTNNVKDLFIADINNSTNKNNNNDLLSFNKTFQINNIETKDSKKIIDKNIIE